MPSRCQRLDGLVLQLGVDVGNRGEIDAVLVHHLGDDLVGAPIDGEQAERREIAGIGRHDAGLHVEQVHHRGRLRRSRAAERQQRKAARIDAALDGHLPDRVGLIPVGDLDDAVGELLDAHVAGQPRGERGDAGARARHVEGDAAADQRSRNATEHQIGVGDGRLAAALRVTHRTGIGARAFRADLEMAFAGDPRDRAAAGADRLDVDHRDAHREGADRATVGDVRLAAFDQAEIGRGAAGIQRDDVRESPPSPKSRRCPARRRRDRTARW